MTDPSDAGADTTEDLFPEILEASAALGDLGDLARVQAWASSVVAVWAEAPDAAELDTELVQWLDGNADRSSARLLLALGPLLAVPAEVLQRARSRLEDPPAWAQVTGPARPGRAWRVRQGSSASIGIGFVLPDGSQTSLLADVDDEILTGLVMAPGPDELFDESEDLIAPEPIDVDVAARSIHQAWERLIAGADPLPESVLVNAAVARVRLEDLLDEDLGRLFRPDLGGTADRAADAMDPQERAELDAWARSVLEGAGVGAGRPGAEALLDPLIPARRAAYPEAEREAFAALEWADWLGVAIGLARNGGDTVVDPPMLIDLVNGCPEVTSAIPKRDRPYYEWAFSMVLPLWTAAGVIDERGRLQPTGADRLIWALRTAWAE